MFGKDWDSYKKASDKAGRVVDAEFEDATNGAGGNQQPETDAERKAREVQEKTQQAEAEKREQYQRNLENLSEQFKLLVEAKNFTDVFPSFKDDKLSDKEKGEDLNRVFNRLRKICSPDNNGDPDNNNKTSDEVRNIAQQAIEILEAFYVEAKASLNKEPGQKKGEKIKDLKEEGLLESLDKARKEFAEVEYRDREWAERIRNAANKDEDRIKKIREKIKGVPENSEEKKKLEKKLEKSVNVRIAEESYQKALKNLLDHKLEKLQNSGLEKDELEKQVKELYSFFNLDETIKHYDVRTQAKIDQLKSNIDKDGEAKGFTKKTFDGMHQGMIKMSEWYSKKVPTPVKVGLAIASLIPGASALSFLRGGVGAATFATSGGVLLDKGFQKTDEWLDKYARNKEFKNISENGNVDFERLKGTLNGKIDNIDKKLNRKNLLGAFNKFAAFSFATFSAVSLATAVGDFAMHGTEAASTKVVGNLIKSGSNAVENITKWANGFLEHGSHAPGAPVSAAEKLKVVNEMQGKGGSLSSNQPKVSAVEKPKVAPLIKSPGATELPSVDKPLTIEIKSPVEMSSGHMRHDSFIRSLKDHLRATNSEIDPEAAETVFHDAAKEYAAAHSMSYQEAVAKLSRIHPGTTYTLTQDAQGLHMHINDDNVKFMKSAGKAAHHVSNAENPKAPSLADVAKDVANPASAPANSSAYNIGGNKENLSGYNPFPDPSKYGVINNNLDSDVDPSGLVMESVNNNVSTVGEVASPGREFFAENVYRHVDIRSFIINHENERALRELRRGIFKNAREFHIHRKDNIFQMVKEHKEIFSPKGRRMMGKILEFKEFGIDKNTDIEKATRNIVRNLAA